MSLLLPRRLVDAWSWLIDGLAEAVLAVAARWRPRPTLQLKPGEGGSVLQTEAGAVVGRLVASGNTQRLELAQPARQLSGARIDLLIPPAWLFRRPLEAVPAESAPYLDAFVRHHIDRITPWRVADVFYHVRQAPLAGDPGRLSVEVGVVPRQVVGASLAALEALRPSRLRLVASLPDGVTFSIPAGTGGADASRRVAAVCRVVVITLALGFGAATGLAWWATSTVRAEIEEQDSLIGTRRAAIAEQRRRAEQDGVAGATLLRLRDRHPRSVDLLEALADAVPDDAYLTDFAIEGDRLRISGVAKDLSRLVPALEASGRFRDVTPSAASTRVEAGTGDTFHLEMQLTPPPPGAAP